MTDAATGTLSVGAKRMSKTSAKAAAERVVVKAAKPQKSAAEPSCASYSRTRR
jgi:hypothetical protein